MRYFLDISYLGTFYHGWQKQKNALSVQQVLDDALKILLSDFTESVGSGRTDTGVHARQQIVHFETSKHINQYSWLPQLNALLPKDIVANSVYPVIPTAHARYDAQWRKYEYIIQKKRSPFMLGQSYVYFQALDTIAMNLAAEKLINYTDFQSFCKSHSDVNHFECTLYEAYWVENDYTLIFTIRANRFLRGMVRAVVGTLMNVGLKRITVDDFERIVASKNRNIAGRSVPAEGLFLLEVQYPEHLKITQTNEHV